MNQTKFIIIASSQDLAGKNIARELEKISIKPEIISALCIADI